VNLAQQQPTAVVRESLVHPSDDLRLCPLDVDFDNRRYR
jgi:hypothetical protein